MACLFLEESQHTSVIANLAQTQVDPGVAGVETFFTEWA